MAKPITYKVSQQGTERVEKKFKDLDNQLKRMRISTKGLQRGLGVLRNRLLLITFTFGGLIVVMKKSIDAFRVQLEAQTRLVAGLKNVEGASESGAQELIKYAAALQQITTFSDEHTISAAAMLSTFQLNETAIAKLLPRVLDMAAATGTKGEGLTSIAILMGKAFTGQVGALSRWGVVIDKSALKIARAKGEITEFNFILGELDKNFKGSAEALRATLLGELDALQNEIGDMNEIIGRTSIPVWKLWTQVKLFAARAAAILSLKIREGISLSEAAGKILVDELIIEKELFNLRLKINSQMEKERLIRTQNLELLQQINFFLSDDAVLDVQEQLLLIETQKLFLSQQLSNEFITQEDFALKSLELSNKALILRGKLTRGEQFGVNLTKQITDNMAQAVVFGQDFGEAMVASIRAIAAELAAKAALFALLNLFTGGSFGGFAQLGSFLGGAPLTKVPAGGTAGTLATPSAPALAPRITDIGGGAPGNNINIQIINPVLLDDAAVNQIAPAIRRAIDLGETSGLN